MDGGAWWAAVHGVAKSWTRLSDFTFTFSLSCIGEGNGNPLQCSCLENPRDGGAWWADVYGVTHCRTQLKRLSSSSRVHHEKRWAGASTSWNQDCRRNINNLRYADDTTLMAESEEELKSLLMKVKVKKLA